MAGAASRVAFGGFCQNRALVAFREKGGRGGGWSSNISYKEKIAKLKKKSNLKTTNEKIHRCQDLLTTTTETFHEMYLMNKRENASWNTGRDNLEGTQMPGSPAKLYKMRFSHGKRYSLLESLPRKMFRLAVVVRPNKSPTFSFLQP